jgi:isopropylmalate/homocitrate/citramalate synthase
MFVRRYKARFQQPLEIHCHEDFGLGVSNTIAALAGGASVAHVTVTGTGERAGNVPLEDTVLSLKALYGVDMGIKTEKLYELSKLVQELTGISVPLNRPIVGDWLYRIESGIVTMFHRRCKVKEPLEYIPFKPELVGRPGISIALGKGSGLANIEEHLEARKHEATPEQAAIILDKVKAKSVATKQLLGDEEFDAIVSEVLGAA